MLSIIISAGIAFFKSKFFYSLLIMIFGCVIVKAQNGITFSAFNPQNIGRFLQLNTGNVYGIVSPTKFTIFLDSFQLSKLDSTYRRGMPSQRGGFIVANSQGWFGKVPTDSLHFPSYTVNGFTDSLNNRQASTLQQADTQLVIPTKAWVSNNALMKGASNPTLTINGNTQAATSNMSYTVGTISDTTALHNQIVQLTAGKFNSPPGNSTQYLDGSGTPTTSKTSLSQFTNDLNAAAINSSLGYTAYNGGSNVNGYISSAALTPYKQITDSGRSTSQYTTGYSLNKVRDSLQTNINTNTSAIATNTSNIATNTSNISTNTANISNLTTSVSNKKNITDSGRANPAYYATAYDLNKVRDSVQGNIPTNNSVLSNGAGYLTGITSGQVTTALGFTPYNATNPNNYITASALTPYKLITDSGRNATNYATGYDLNKVRDSLQANISGITGFVPTSRQITINGTAQTLAADRSWTIGVPLYNVSGLVNSNAKIFTDTISVASATPTVSLSSYLTAMGCSNFKILAVTGYRIGASTSSSPNVSVTGVTSNSVSLIFNQTNTATVTILSIAVLSGLPTILVPDPANIKCVLTFAAW